MNTFSQLALAFHCDQYTLDQRLQAEEQARNRAEENLLLEVERGQDLLETLKGMCLDIKRAKVIQSLELCLSIIRGTIERIANTAEVLGAVHQQEAKVSRAVELMVAHVENLRRRHERDSVELEEIRKQMQKSSRGRQVSEIWGKFAHFALFLSVYLYSHHDRTQRGTESTLMSSEEAAGAKSSTQVQLTEGTASKETSPDQKSEQLDDGRQLKCAEDGSSAADNACPHPFSPEHQQETELPWPPSMLPRHRLKSKSALEGNCSRFRGSQQSLSECNPFTTGLYAAPPDALDVSLPLDNYCHLPPSAMFHRHTSQPSLVSTGSCVVIVNQNARQLYVCRSD
ncbi:hypothetical protein NFI96_030657, partial [Prochilodus magdalenae]